MDEKLEIIHGLENTIEKLQSKNQKYKEINSQISQQYSSLKKKHLIMVFLIILIDDCELFLIY